MMSRDEVLREVIKNRLIQCRKEKLLAEASLQAIRENRVVGINALAQLCDLLDLQPGDIIEYRKEQ